MNTALGAAELLYGNYQKKDAMGMTISGLTIASGLSSMVGGPVGIVVAMVLQLIKTTLVIINMSSKGPPESDSSKLEKAIKKALEKFTETGISADWNGYQRLTDAYLKHLEMIDHFDEMKPLEGKDENKVDFGEMGDLEQVRQQLFDEVTPQIYKVLMSSTHLLGKVEFHITKVCNFDIQANKVESKWSLQSKFPNIIANIEEEPIPSSEEINEKDSFASDCLKLYELYAKISSYHFQTYLKSLEAIDKIIGSLKKTTDASTSNEKQAKTKRKAFVFMHLLLDMIQNSREYNKKVFKAFLNPFDNYKMRYTVNFYYNNEKSYAHLTAYLKDFFNDDETMKTIPKKVMFCSQQSLLGSCYLEDGGEAQMPGPWRSSYIPKGKSITVQYKDDKSNDIKVSANGAPIKLVGPSSMGMLYTIKMRSNSEKINLMKEFDKYVKKIVIAEEVEPKKAAVDTMPLTKKIFKMCVARDYNQDSAKHQGSVCITDEFNGGKKIIKLKEIKSPTYWFGKNISISSSEPDLAFVASFFDPSLAKVTNKAVNARWGPFFSPFPMMELPASTQWDTITVYKYKNDEESNIGPLKEDNSHCKAGNNYLCQSDIIDKKLFVTICKQAELKGYCEEIPVLKKELTPDGGGKKLVDLKMINGAGVYGKVPLDETSFITADTEDKPGGKPNIKEFHNYYAVDSSIWKPLLWKPVAVNGKKKARNLLQSMKVPDNILVELYTEFGGKGKLFGPYQGPITVDRIDGNDVISNIIYSIVIKSSAKEVATEEMPPDGTEPELSEGAENLNMPNNAGPSPESTIDGLSDGTTPIGNSTKDSTEGSKKPF